MKELFSLDIFLGPVHLFARQNLPRQLTGDLFVLPIRIQDTDGGLEQVLVVALLVFHKDSKVGRGLLLSNVKFIP